ncbi:hypothetical protein MTR67_034213 [Solanum verrucosum]|uniref:Uncharacterized protein n=1 Tax=Solanum verrucosum TaxID=315347 RepID=A0AAF0U7U5_SOLVR|nr:hypothetical protein MTR67_034213 [Solanum verrucosum]
MQELARTWTKELNLDGKIVVPGFIDSHVHFIPGGLENSRGFVLFLLFFSNTSVGQLRKLSVSDLVAHVWYWKGTWNLIFQSHNQPREDHLTRSVRTQNPVAGREECEAHAPANYFRQLLHTRHVGACVTSESDQIFIYNIVSIFPVRFCGLLFNRPQLG